MGKRYNVHSSLWGSDYIETKDGITFIRENSFGEKYLDTKKGPVFFKHDISGYDYVKLPKKEDDTYKAPSVKYEPPKIDYSHKQDFSSYTHTHKRKYFPISSALILMAIYIGSVCIQIPETVLMAIYAIFNLIIIFIPREPACGKLLYRFFTATIFLGAIGVFTFAANWTDNALITLIVSVVYVIIFKLILSHKISDD